MIIHQEDSYDKNYTVNFYIDNIEIIKYQKIILIRVNYILI